MHWWQIVQTVGVTYMFYADTQTAKALNSALGGTQLYMWGGYSWVAYNY